MVLLHVWTFVRDGCFRDEWRVIRWRETGSLQEGGSARKSLCRMKVLQKARVCPEEQRGTAHSEGSVFGSGTDIRSSPQDSTVGLDKRSHGSIWTVRRG